MNKLINEGPEEGAESAAVYKAATPGQEAADNIPYKNEDEIVNDDIKKMIAAVSSRIMCMGLKESVRKFGIDWRTISKFLDTFEEDGINKLVEHLKSLNEIKGKPLRSIVEEIEIAEVDNLNYIRKSNKLDLNVGKKMKFGDGDYEDVKIGKFQGHDIYSTFDWGTQISWSVVDPKTNIKHIELLTDRGKGDIYTVHMVASTGKGPKVPDFYHYLLKNHVTGLVATEQSEGGKKIWQRLAKKKGLSVHGWSKGKAVNVDPQDDEETHGNSGSSDKEEREISRMKLVASYNKTKKKKNIKESVNPDELIDDNTMLDKDFSKAVKE